MLCPVSPKTLEGESGDFSLALSAATVLHILLRVVRLLYQSTRWSVAIHRRRVVFKPTVFSAPGVLYQSVMPSS